MSRRLEMMRLIGGWLLPGYRFKWPDLAWWDDSKFTEYLAEFNELDGYNTDRRWNLFQLVRLIVNVPGDTAECGVYRGATSYAICLALEEMGQVRTHHGFDSFQGLSTPEMIDGDYWRKGDLSSGVADATQALARFPNVELHQGWIPEQFGDVEDRTFALLHIDVDLYKPTIESLRFFYQRMADRGVIVFDDYGFKTCPGATAAVDEFFADKPEPVIGLASGGGFTVKAGR